MKGNSKMDYNMVLDVNSGTQENFTLVSGNAESFKVKGYFSLHMADI
jgi:hypothetical protein